MATISKTGIADGLTSKAEHLTRIIDALDGTATTEVVATGSFTGSFTGDGSGLTGVGGGANKLHLTFSDPKGGAYISGRTLTMGNGSLNRLAGTPSPSNVENYFQVPVTGTIVSSSIAFQANGGTVSDGNVLVSLFNLDTDVSQSMFNAITLFAATTSSMINTNLSVNAGDRIAMILDIGTLAGSVGADGRVNGTALLIES